MFILCKCQIWGSKIRCHVIESLGLQKMPNGTQSTGVIFCCFPPTFWKWWGVPLLPLQFIRKAKIILPCNCLKHFTGVDIGYGPMSSCFLFVSGASLILMIQAHDTYLMSKRPRLWSSSTKLCWNFLGMLFCGTRDWALPISWSWQTQVTSVDHAIRWHRTPFHTISARLNYPEAPRRLRV